MMRLDMEHSRMFMMLQTGENPRPVVSSRSAGNDAFRFLTKVQLLCLVCRLCIQLRRVERSSGFWMVMSLN